MSFCGNCGGQVGEGIKFCPGCGASMEVQGQNTGSVNQSNFSDNVIG